MKIKKTSRGFEIIEFKDYYGQNCSLQQSSLVIYTKPGASAIWFGLGKERIHLDYKLLEKLLPHLQAWVKNGSFKKMKED